MSAAPFDDRDGWIWYDGAFVPWRDARVHVLTHGLHYASSVFEGARIYGGRIFKLDEHSRRLVRSARLLDMEIPYSVEQIGQACIDTAGRMGLADGYVRPVAWRGSEVISISAKTAKIHLAVAVWEWPSYFAPEQRIKGIRLTTARWKRPSPETIPSEAKAAGLYMICTLSKHEAERAGYSDAMMLDYRGFIAEATGANIFFVRDGVIHTPTPDCFLNGITRQTVIALAREKGINVVERHIKPEELDTFTECFLTGSAAELTPVSEISGTVFRPGELTLAIMDAYSECVRRPS
jgi:branched-chain amino acid aminotransferase